MANCHFELGRDCGLGCFSELLSADIQRLSVVAVLLYQITVFLQQNTAASLLELYFNDSMQTVYACSGVGSQQREVADGADVVFTDTRFTPSSWTFNTWTYSTFAAHSVKTQASSFGCFLTTRFTVWICHAEFKRNLLTRGWNVLVWNVQGRTDKGVKRP